MSLVTIDEAKAHLRIMGSIDDPWLELWIPIVQATIEAWLKEPWRVYQVETDSDGQHVLDSDGEPVLVLDSDGEPIPRFQCKGAALIELAVLYRDRERGTVSRIGGVDLTQVPENWGHGHVLSIGATQLLVPLRKSTYGGGNGN